jgi:predicted nucleic acid-binding protein
LIHLARLGKLGYARSAFSSLMIPPTVRKETIEAGKAEGYSDALNLEGLENNGWLKTVHLSNSSDALADELSQAVGRGEAEAIALAVEKRERLFMDDLKGRRTAELYKVETTTTLGIMLELLVSRALTKTDYTRNVKMYGGQGWISGEVLNEFLERGANFD